MTWSASILGAPRTKKTHQRIVTNKRTGKPFIIQSKANLGWAHTAQLQLQAQWRGASITAPVALKATFYRDRRLGDLTGYLQALCDVLQGAGVVLNDRQVESLDGCRLDVDRENPRVELELTW